MSRSSTAIQGKSQKIKKNTVSTIFLQVAVYSLCLSLSLTPGFNHSWGITREALIVIPL